MGTFLEDTFPVISGNFLKVCGTEKSKSHSELTLVNTPPQVNRQLGLQCGEEVFVPLNVFSAADSRKIGGGNWGRGLGKGQYFLNG